MYEQEWFELPPGTKQIAKDYLQIDKEGSTWQGYNLNSLLWLCSGKRQIKYREKDMGAWQLNFTSHFALQPCNDKMRTFSKKEQYTPVKLKKTFQSLGGLETERILL